VSSLPNKRLQPTLAKLARLKRGVDMTYAVKSGESVIEGLFATS